MWFGFAVGSAFFAGITSILAKCGIKRTDSDVATAIRTIVVLIFAWIMVVVTGTGSAITSISARTMTFLILSGIATGASWLCYFKALQLGDVNKVVPIDKSSTVLTILLAFIILGEKRSVWKVVGIIGSGAGTFLMIQKKDSTGEKKTEKGWLIYAVLSAVFASLTSILGKIGISGVDSNLGTAIRTVVVLFMAWIVVFVKGKQCEVKKVEKKELGFIVLSGIATGSSWLCYYRALQMGEASKVVPIDKLSVVITLVLAFVFLHEEFTAKSLIGCILIGVGTLVMVL